jgi:NhaP-type Na+/H+ or K+/H+ antiporter
MQLKKHSFFEATVNLIIGYTINFIANILIFPLFGWQISVTQNIGLGIIYTVISLARQYVLRRIFTHITEKEK